MKKILLLTFCLLTVSMQSQQWVLNYPCEEGVVLIGGDCNGNGNYIIGACNKDEL